MRAVASAWIALLAAGGVACSSVPIRYQHDLEADFSSWWRYAWYPTPRPASGDPPAAEPELRGRVEAAIDDRLAALGFTRAAAAPDFYVNFHLSVERRLRTREMDRVYVEGPQGKRWGGAGWAGIGFAPAVVHEYEAGVLVIDLVDARRRRLAWRGWGTRRLSWSPNPDRVGRRVEEAVDEVLGQFPPIE